MAGGALYFTTHAEFAFVTKNRLQFSGFANQADSGLVRTSGERIQQSPHPEAPDFLIIRNGQMQRLHQRLRKKVGDSGENAGNKAFHVRCATTIQFAIALRQGERGNAPVLPVHGHHIAVAR